MKDAEIVRALGVSICTVERARGASAGHGLQIAVHDWPPQRQISRRKVDGWTEAHLIAASCAAPREGRSRWTLKLPGDHVVALGLVDSVNPRTIGRVFKKTS